MRNNPLTDNLKKSPVELNNFNRAHKIEVKKWRIWKKFQKIDQWLDNKNVNIDKCFKLLHEKC